MEPNRDPLAPVERPDLEEFLSALNGFLDKQTTPQDPSYQKFLDIFCRTLGAGEGHLLRNVDGRGMESVISFGIGPEFDADYNAAKSKGRGQPSPLDRAFEEQKVVAIVELKRTREMPDWFMDLMDHHGFRSLVAVPLLGHSAPVGILCAYYHDLCLFDQGTLDRLLVLGRMVGAATEKSQVAGRVETIGANEKVLDEFLRNLQLDVFTKMQIYEMLARVAAPLVSATGLICGPLRATQDGGSITVAHGIGIPSSSISGRFTLPLALSRILLSSGPTCHSLVIHSDEWGSLHGLTRGENAVAVASSIFWKAQPLAGLVAWRPVTRPFDEQEVALFGRLSGVAALALNVA